MKGTLLTSIISYFGPGNSTDNKHSIADLSSSVLPNQGKVDTTDCQEYPSKFTSSSNMREVMDCSSGHSPETVSTDANECVTSDNSVEFEGYPDETKTASPYHSEAGNINSITSGVSDMLAGKDFIDEGNVCKAQDVESDVGKQQGEETSVDAEIDTLSKKSDDNELLTEEIFAEERRCHDEQEKECDIFGKEAMAELETNLKEQRSARLHHLLEKSNFYAQFLLERMEQQKTKEREKREKQVELNNNEPSLHNGSMPSNNERKTEDNQVSQDDTKGAPGRKSKRKRKPAIHKYNISDVVDEQTVQSASKRQKVEQSGQKSPLNSGLNNVSDANDAQKAHPGPQLPDQQPKLITGGSLRPYQIEGVEWLKGLYENGINGILADEMGLGKTIQCIGLIAYIIEQGVKGPFLIVGPLSTLPNWMAEFRKFAPKVNTLLYHGIKDARPRLRRKIRQLRGEEYRTAPVVVTSYEIVMADRQHLQSFPWKFIIVDEGHRLKNLNCKLIRELKSIKSANRLLLTGTPLQNNLAELWSLLNFLLPDIFDDLNSFQAWFDFSEVRQEGGYERLIAKEQEEAVLQKLHSILTPFLLRRLKTDVELAIPPKKEIMVYAPITKKQEAFYRETLDRTIYQNLKKKHLNGSSDENGSDAELTKSGRPSRKSSQNVSYKLCLYDEDEDFDEYLKLLQEEEERINKEKQKSKKANSSNSTAILNVTHRNILMQLRKCCNHPYLIAYPLDPKTNDYLITEDLITCSGKMLLLDKMLPSLRNEGRKVLIFSQMTKMLDIIQDYCWLRKYPISRLDGSMAFAERQEQINQFNEDGDVFVFLLSTRAGGLGLNLAAADTVIIYDSDWNPQNDLQAQDRAHRIGQTKPVVVYRFVTANTIDQRIVDAASCKRKLEKMVIHKGRFKGKGSTKALSPQELLNLLKSNDYNAVETADDANNVISEESLRKLLDRTDLTSSARPGETSVVSDDTSGLFKVIDSSEGSMPL